MIYLYAFCDAPAAGLDGRTGFAGRPLEALSAGAVSAVFGRIEPPAPPPIPENLWLHEEVAESLMTGPAVLPVRFATTFADEPALRDVLERHGSRLAPGLDRVRGLVEIGVRILAPADDDEPATRAVPAAGGRAYLQVRAAEEHRRQSRHAEVARLGGDLHGQLLPLAREGTFSDQRAPMTAAAYLVPPAAVGQFRGQVEQFARRHPGVRVLCTGPWPPYHFVPGLPPPEVQRA